MLLVGHHRYPLYTTRDVRWQLRILESALSSEEIEGQLSSSQGHLFHVQDRGEVFSLSWREVGRSNREYLTEFSGLLR